MAHTRLFRFHITVDATAVPESIQDRFSFDIAGYCLKYDIGELAGPVHTSEDLDGWERVDMTGISDLALSTVEKSHFWIGVTVLPNSKLDPDAPESQPLLRGLGMHTDDFVPVKASEWPDLVKGFPHGVFILRVDLVALYVPLLVPGLDIFNTKLAEAGIRKEDIVFHGMDPDRDTAGKAVSTQHHVVWWSGDLRLSGRKYVP
jgi:hypothetical protein